MTGLFVALFIFILYFAPSLYAFQKKRKNVNAITLLNLLLGWSVLGWIFALVWAAKED